jgi:hypothetical protein
MVTSSSSYGSTAQFGPWPPLLKRSFVTITFLQGWIFSPAPYPQPGGPGLRIYDPRWPSYTPRHWVPILVAFYDMHGLQWDYCLILATTRESWSLGSMKYLPKRHLTSADPHTHIRDVRRLSAWADIVAGPGCCRLQLRYRPVSP